MAAITLNDLLNPQISRVTRSLEGLVIMIYGQGGLGKTPVEIKKEKPYYLAFGKSGISGLNLFWTWQILIRSIRFCATDS